MKEAAKKVITEALACFLPFLGSAMPAAAWLYAPRYLPLAFLGMGLCLGWFGILLLTAIQGAQRAAARLPDVHTTIVNEAPGVIRIKVGKSDFTIETGGMAHLLNGQIRRLERHRLGSKGTT